MVSLGIPRLPPTRVPYAPIASSSARRISVNQETAPWSSSLQKESKKLSSTCAIELQGKPARTQCPPATLTNKIQAH